jgi:hypothetical protein
MKGCIRFITHNFQNPRVVQTRRGAMLHLHTLAVAQRSLAETRKSDIAPSSNHFSPGKSSHRGWDDVVAIYLWGLALNKVWLRGCCSTETTTATTPFILRLHPLPFWTTPSSPDPSPRFTQAQDEFAVFQILVCSAESHHCQYVTVV